MCYVHNFSPHKTLIWNNSDITVNKKSLYKEAWIERGIIYVSALFDNKGHLYSYEPFLRTKSFPIIYKEFIIPTGIIE